MGAREKLNGSYVFGSLALAGLIGLVSHSWFVFGVALLILIGVNMISGDIQLKRRRRR